MTTNQLAYQNLNIEKDKLEENRRHNMANEMLTTKVADKQFMSKLISDYIGRVNAHEANNTKPLGMINNLLKGTISAVAEGFNSWAQGRDFDLNYMKNASLWNKYV